MYKARKYKIGKGQEADKRKMRAQVNGAKSSTTRGRQKKKNDSQEKKNVPRQGKIKLVFSKGTLDPNVPRVGVFCGREGAKSSATIKRVVRFGTNYNGG
jgi:hypothetical protein